MLLRTEQIVKEFPARSKSAKPVRAVDGVSLHVAPGETLSIVGESGCGKTTLARCITRLTDVTSGRIEFDGHDITHLEGAALRPLRRQMQVVFQDPHSSLNPRHSIGSAIGEPLLVHGVARGNELAGKVRELMEMVGLDPADAERYPHEFSGGQRQRICIARAIALRPSLVVCDEPVSSLDVSIRAQILNLLKDLQAQLGLAYLFISHDLAVVRHISDRVAVMHAGQIVEEAPPQTLFIAPQHPYTKQLLDSSPKLPPEPS